MKLTEELLSREEWSRFPVVGTRNKGKWVLFLLESRSRFHLSLESISSAVEEAEETYLPYGTVCH
jgi:hypothetical protein